ncbi:MAG TPA: plastocyanin/azurin family copper-binding protein [Nitrososphaerales archaeon]|nr:plastocyanin/azurin family copper-binding protein [Nitrososphaerales archaeon]
MKTTIAISAVVIIILAAGITYFVIGAGAGKTTSSLTPTLSGTTSTTSTGTATSSAQLETVTVSIPNGTGTNVSLNYLPANITLVIGVNNTVTWTNNDAAPHTVTAVSVPSGAAKFNSGNMNPGATFTYTFTLPGTYSYDCTYHYWMRGTVTVEEGP